MRKTDNFGLLIVNPQVDFCSPQGFVAKLGRHIEPITTMIPVWKRFYQQARALKMPIIFTKYVARKDLSPKNLKINKNREEKARLCLLNSSGADFYSLIPKDPDVVVVQRYFDAFAKTNLKQQLKDQGVNNLLITGVRTELSVEATAKRAISEGFEVILLRDLIATYSEHRQYQDLFFHFFNRYYGTVKLSREVFSDLQDYYL